MSKALGSYPTGLPQVRARMKRLEELETRLAADAARWEESVEPLKGMERLWYAGFLRQAVAALRNARTSLEAVADRLGRNDSERGLNIPPAPHRPGGTP